MNAKFFQPQALRKYNPPEKYSKTYDADTYIFHIDTIYRVPEKVAVDSKIKQLPIWKIITGKWTSGEFEFEHYEFIFAFFNLEFTVFNMMKYIDIMQLAGGPGIMIYILLYLIISMPLIIYYTFISMYSRAGLIKFWNSVPIGKGFAYSYIFYKIVMCILNVPICGMFLWYLLKMILTDPMKADINLASYINKYYTGEIICEQTLTNITSYGSILYLRTKFNYKYEGGSKIFFLNWWFLTIVAWVIIYITMLCGFRRLYKMLHKINLCLLFLFFIPVTLYTIYINRSYNFMVNRNINFLNPEIWVRMGAFLLQGMLPGVYMTFAALTKPDFIPEVGVLWMYILTAALFLVASRMVLIIQEKIHWKYIGSGDCTPSFSGIEMVMAIFPEFLKHRFIGGYIIILYFVALFYWSICSILYTLHGLLETVFMTYPNLTKYRLFISTGLLSLATIVTAVIFVSNGYFPVFIAMQENALFYIYFMVILMVLSILIYSIRRYENDYYFDYSRKVHPCVKFGIQLSIIYCIVMVILYVLYGLPIMDFSNLINSLLNLLVFICIAPVFIYVSITEYQSRGQDTYTLFKPTPSWGPANKDRKQSRRRCDPEREFKYRVDLPCTHMCLQDSKYLHSEQGFWRSRLEYFTSLQKVADDYEKEFTTVINRNSTIPK